MTDGLVVIDKPVGWTSHDVVARCRKVFGQKRVGHAGTLDPDATGVLVVGLGRVTRLMRFFTESAKTYAGEVVLGVATSTLDAAGDVVGTWDMSAVSVDDARRAAVALTGEILQVPPMVSAIQIDGKRLHKLARQGIEIERPPRSVTVHRFEVSDGPQSGVLRIEVECSAGTYIRTLAADLGAALGGGAHLRNLRRTAAGSFTVDDACALDDVGSDRVLSPADALRGMVRVVVDADGAREVSFGRPLALEAQGDGPVAVVDDAGRLVAVYERVDGRWKPAVVLAAAGS